MRRRYVGIFPEKLICQKYNGNVNKITKNICLKDTRIMHNDEKKIENNCVD